MNAEIFFKNNDFYDQFSTYYSSISMTVYGTITKSLFKCNNLYFIEMLSYMQILTFSKNPNKFHSFLSARSNDPKARQKIQMNFW